MLVTSTTILTQSENRSNLKGNFSALKSLLLSIYSSIWCHLSKTSTKTVIHYSSTSKPRGFSIPVTTVSVVQPIGEIKDGEHYMELFWNMCTE